MPEVKMVNANINNKEREARFTLLGEYGYGIESSVFKRKIIEYLEKEPSPFHLIEIKEVIMIPQGGVKVGILIFKNKNVWEKKDIDTIAVLINEIIKENSSPVPTIRAHLVDDDILHRF